MSVRPFVCLSIWNSLVPTGWVFMKSDVWVCFENLLRKFEFVWNLTRIKGALLEDIYALLIIAYWILCRMRNVSDKSRENQNTHMFHNFFRKLVPLWDNVEKYGRFIRVAGESVIWCSSGFTYAPQRYICTYIAPSPQMLFGSIITLICWLHLHVIFPTQFTCTKLDESQERWRNYLTDLIIFTSHLKFCGCFIRNCGVCTIWMHKYGGGW